MCTGEIGGGLSHDALSTREWLYEADKQAELAVGRVYVTAVSASCSGVRRTFDSTPSYSASVPDSPSCEDDGLACQNVAKDTSRATMVMRKICPKIA
jgi:hypothetical protein